MKLTLTWTVPGAPKGTITLIDSPGAIPYSNWQINGSRIIQEASFFRGTSKKFYDRGNRKTEISFDTTREFKSQSEIETFILMHETQFPVLNDASAGGPFLVSITAGIAGGGSTTTRFLKNAAVENTHSAIFVGCTAKFSYRITGGTMSTTPN